MIVNRKSMLIGLILITAAGAASNAVWAQNARYSVMDAGPGAMRGMGPVAAWSMSPAAGPMVATCGFGPMGGVGMVGMGEMGPGGMMGMGPMHMLDLTSEQRHKIRVIGEELRKQHWDMMGKIMEQQSLLQDLYDVDHPDAKQIGKVYGQIFDLRRQMIEASVVAGNRTRDVLTKEQQEQLQQMRHGHHATSTGQMGRSMGRSG